MKKIQVQQLEKTNGGNCFFAIPILIATAATPVTSIFTPVAWSNVVRCWYS